MIAVLIRAGPGAHRSARASRGTPERPPRAAWRGRLRSCGSRARTPSPAPADRKGPPPAGSIALEARKLRTPSYRGFPSTYRGSRRPVERDERLAGPPAPVRQIGVEQLLPRGRVHAGGVGHDAVRVEDHRGDVEETRRSGSSDIAHDRTLGAADAGLTRRILPHSPSSASTAVTGTVTGPPDHVTFARTAATGTTACVRAPRTPPRHVPRARARDAVRPTVRSGTRHRPARP